jgi:hypothetical protein
MKNFLVISTIAVIIFKLKKDTPSPMGKVQRTDPDLWEKSKKIAIKKYGDSPDSWDARIAQQSVRIYKKLGGGYIGKKSPSNSLSKWTRENWEYCGGKGGRYLPRAVCKELTPKQRKITASNKKRGGGEGHRVKWEPFVLKAFKKAGVRI